MPNAAESGVTIPDCDHVIDLGTAKELTYNAATHAPKHVGSGLDLPIFRSATSWENGSSPTGICL